MAVFLFLIPVLLIMSLPRILKWIYQRRRLISLIDVLPGPPALPIVGCAYRFSFDSYKFTYFMEEVFNEFSSGFKGKGLFRMWIGPVPVVFICRAEGAKSILENNQQISKPKEGYKRLEEWLGRGLLTSTGDRWRSRRKMLTPAFHFNILNNFIPIFNKEVGILIKQLEYFSTNANVVDIFPLIKLCTLDVICESAMGVDIRAQHGDNEEYVRSVKEVCNLIWDRERLPWLWFRPIWILSGKAACYHRALNTVQRFSRNVIAERKRTFNYKREDSGQKLAFLDLLISMQKENKLTDEDLREEVDTFMFEGHDTVSSSLSYAIFCLGHNLEEQDKLFEEVRAVIGEYDRELTIEDIRNLKQTEKVLKESLRIFPPVPMIARELTEDTKIEGVTIPAGVTTIVVPYGTHRDPLHFEHPSEFFPDHFDVKKCTERNPFAFIPWSAGPRNCIGQKFALLEEKIILARLIRQFRFQSTMTFEENRGLPELILRPSKGITVTIERRI